jgi:hypothetical protein
MDLGSCVAVLTRDFFPLGVPARTVSDGREYVPILLGKTREQLELAITDAVVGQPRFLTS